MYGLSKAKYVFSIHLNSITEANSESGVEIYVPSKTDLKFAKVFADNIVKYANTHYSTLEATYRKADGVYVRTFKDWEIEESNEEALKKRI
ncbi:MAG: N-acetylmuramoyl-L-alanine amidase [Clostridia bacterium]|nr:N-acetylmuramoyl-L-alanine amidase [Clostridia bacterium]